MKRLSLLAAGVIVHGFVSSPALALSARTFVSGAGSDAGVCPVSTPCRTFAYALTQTAPSGEVIVLSSAGYGPVTITQSVSIINTSNFAGVTVASGNGITVNAGDFDSVTLRGLTVDGGSGGSNGIVFNTGAKLTIDQCDVMNFTVGGANGNGILMQPASGSHKVVITNTTATNNQNGVSYQAAAAGTATTGIVVDRVTANNNSYGFNISNITGTAKVAISNSIASFNTHNGFFFLRTTASLDASSASNNGESGVFVNGGTTTLALGRSVIMNNNTFGVEIFGTGTLNSYQDNRIAGNTSGQISGTPAIATLY